MSGPADERIGRKQDRRITLQGLLILVGSFAILFAATRSYRSLGFVFGGLVMQAALGHVFKFRHWIVGACCGILVLVTTHYQTWQTHGFARTLERYQHWEKQSQLETVVAWLHDHRNEHGDFPERLADLMPEKSNTRWNMSGGAEAENILLYENQGAAFELIHPGDDGVRGGTGFDADISGTTPFHDESQFSDEAQRPDETQRPDENQRVALHEFLEQGYDKHSMSCLLLIALVTSGAVASISKSPNSSGRAEVFGILVTVAVATVVGALMAGFHIVAGQSSH